MSRKYNWPVKMRFQLTQTLNSVLEPVDEGVKWRVMYLLIWSVAVDNK